VGQVRPKSNAPQLVLLSNNGSSEGCERRYSYRDVIYEVHARFSENLICTDEVRYEIASMKIKNIVSCSTKDKTAVAEKTQSE
jgi:hypothetical protein